MLKFEILYDEPIKSKASITKRVVDGLKKKRNEEFSIKKMHSKPKVMWHEVLKIKTGTKQNIK